MDTSGSESVRFQTASDQSLLVYFGNAEPQTQTNQADSPQLTVDRKKKRKQEKEEGERTRRSRRANEDVRKLLRVLELEPIVGVRNLHPAYTSLLVEFDAFRWRHEELEKKLRGYLERLGKIRLPEPKPVEIPVCYGGEFGPDLNDVATIHGMTPDQVIELHASATYLVYFLGFVPGFAYLGELPEVLVTPRLGTPRKRVPEGSVGIGGNQTGVYPFATPGGWRLLGRTPLAMFRADREGLSLLSIGDRVRFVPISQGRFAELEREEAERSASEGGRYPR